MSGRLLSPLESIQRDAIVQSLLDHQGNKARAAESLGMSRAMTYRKIHEYGIVNPGQLTSLRRPNRHPIENSGAPRGRGVSR